MNETQIRRDGRRADRWLDRFGGGLPPLDPAAHGLLAARLRARRRAALLCSPLLAVVAVLLLSTLAGLFQDVDLTVWAHDFAVRYLLAIVLLMVTMLAADHLWQQADRRLVGDLTRRVTRGRRVAIREMLGPRATRATALTVAFQTGLGVLVAATDHGGWLTRAYVGGLVATTALTGVRLHLISARPTVAGDPASLAVDERLRANDGVAAASTLGLITLAFGPGMEGVAPPHSALRFAWLFGYLAVQVLWMFATVQPRWPRTPVRWANASTTDEGTADPVFRSPSEGGVR